MTTDYYNADIAQLLGKTLASVTQNGRDSIDFVAETGERWTMHHRQDCCENVELEDVVDDWQDLIGSPIVMAEASTNRENPKEEGGYLPDSFTWTFYKFATAKGYVTVRWYGTSNGYYSETVSFWRANP